MPNQKDKKLQPGDYAIVVGQQEENKHHYLISSIVKITCEPFYYGDNLIKQYDCKLVWCPRYHQNYLRPTRQRIQPKCLEKINYTENLDSLLKLLFEQDGKQHEHN